MLCNSMPPTLKQTSIPHNGQMASFFGWIRGKELIAPYLLSSWSERLPAAAAESPPGMSPTKCSKSHSRGTCTLFNETTIIEIQIARRRHFHFHQNKSHRNFHCYTHNKHHANAISLIHCLPPVYNREHAYQARGYIRRAGLWGVVRCCSHFKFTIYHDADFLPIDLEQP